jgi:hypothetical protein
MGYTSRYGIHCSHMGLLLPTVGSEKTRGCTRWLNRRRGYNRAETESTDFVRIDFENSSYPAHIWLYIFCGLLDSMWQTAVYWMMVGNLPLSDHHTLFQPSLTRVQCQMTLQNWLISQGFVRDVVCAVNLSDVRYQTNPSNPQGALSHGDSMRLRTRT